MNAIIISKNDGKYTVDNIHAVTIVKSSVIIDTKEKTEFETFGKTIVDLNDQSIGAIILYNNDDEILKINNIY